MREFRDSVIHRQETGLDELRTDMNYIDMQRSIILVEQALQSRIPTDYLPIMRTELLARRHSDLRNLSAQEQFDLLHSRAINIIPPERLLELLQRSKTTGDSLKVKFGVDPTGSELHIGHACPMVLLNRLRRMGHEITLIIGDFTAKIGDPSGRSTQRPKLDDEAIKKNFATYTEQIAPFFDFSSAKIVYNGTWLNKIELPAFIETLAKVGISELLQRDDFRQRLDKGEPLSVAEVIYSVVMAIDSVELKSDVEVGGLDQLLNMQMCRRVMEISGCQSETIITTDILPGTTGDGRKMSKSFGNYVGLSHPADEVFGRVMSIPDSLMETYFKALTEIVDSEWDELNAHLKAGTLHPMELKRTLAWILTATLYQGEKAEDSAQAFDTKFSKRDYAHATVTHKLSPGANEKLLDVLLSAKVISSKSEGRRLMDGNGMKLLTEGKPQEVKDPNITVEALVGRAASVRVLVGRRYVVEMSANS